MNVRPGLIVAVLYAVLSASVAVAASPHIVLSQVYGGGGSSSGTPAYTNDYVELFNTSTATVSIGGHSLQYGSSTGNFGNSGNVFTFPAGTSIPPGGYLLIKLGGTGSLGATFTADFTSTGLSMAAGSGKVALVTTGTALGCGATATPCALPDARVIDVVAWGASNNGEGGTTVNNGTGLDSTKGAVRKANGCQDTDSNSSDFAVATTGSGLVPRRASSPTHTCAAGNQPPAIAVTANPIATVPQDAAPFNVSLSGSDDGAIYAWSATPGTGVSAVTVAAGQGTPNVTYTVSLQAGFAGTATFTASLSDASNPAVTRAVNIAVTPLVANDPPAIAIAANPIATVAQDAAPFVVSLSGADDNAVYNWSAGAGTGVSAVAVSGGQGTSSAAFTVTLQPGFSGTAAFTALLSDNVNAPATQVVNISVTPAPPPPLDHVVISQVYGGGGNSGATYRNDYVELYNPSTVPFDLAGWTVQYGSATGSTWQAQPLGGIIQPGEYYLIALASGGAVGATLPAANITGEINASATAGKIALVSDGFPLSVACPAGDPSLVDLVGYGSSANCREGSTSAAAASNTTALFRKNGGFTDTNTNGADFFTGAPNPRRTSPIVEIGPAVLSTDPRPAGTNAPRDASVSVTFTEAVSLDEGWFNISCASTGLHNEATIAGGPNTWIITPNVNFLAGEQCSVTIARALVHDQDFDDSAANTDTLASNYTFSFTVSTGTPPPYSPDVHLTMGNPSNATADLLVPDNYLMEKPEFTLSYNRDRGTPNWVSWHLDDLWVGSLSRVDTFRPDPAVPADWYRVLHTDYFSSGFDRGHLVPNADRDKETSSPINQATFLMTNMMPQAPDNNQGPWANLENYLRTLLPANEIYIVAGGAGVGGTGSAGFTSTIAGGKVTVPAQTWKVALVLPKDSGDDVGRVSAASRTLAVIMPNTQGIRTNNANDWQAYLTTVDQVEALTGYDFFANVGDAVENSIEAGINGANPPGVEDQSVTATEDTARTFTLESVSPNSNPLTYTIVSGPTNGSLSGSGASQTYTPAPDFNGTDSFTFRVSDGTRYSNTATVTISVMEVNDAPSATNDSRSTSEDTPLQFAAAELSANDSAGPSNENGQALTVTNVSGTADTHGTVGLAGGVITYTPDANFHGPASFTYVVCDGGLCASGTVAVDVMPVNDAPSVSIALPATGAEGTSVAATVSVSDVDENESFAYAWTVTRNGAAYASGTGEAIAFTPDDDGSYAVSVIVTDAGGATGSASQSVVVTNVSPAVVSVSGPAGPLQLGASAAISVSYVDSGAGDTHTALFSWDDGTSSTVVACEAGTCTATRTYAAAGVYGVSVVITDDDGASVPASFQSVVVYDENGGFVTGGGTIDGLSFNLMARYDKGVPSGKTAFRLNKNGFDFQSTSYEWLVVTGSRAQYRGIGTVNGAGPYAFLVTVMDTPDKLRLRVWDPTTNAVVYDNMPGGSDDIDDTSLQPIGSGSIVIHR